MHSSHPPGSKETAVAAYLRREAERRGGELYVKSKVVAGELDLSAKEVGACIGRLEDRDVGLEIERWAYSGATTWRVSLDG